jgi:hypothetical protein
MASNSLSIRSVLSIILFLFCLWAPLMLKQHCEWDQKSNLWAMYSMDQWVIEPITGKNSVLFLWLLPSAKLPEWKNNFLKYPLSALKTRAKSIHGLQQNAITKSQPFSWTLPVPGMAYTIWSGTNFPPLTGSDTKTLKIPIRRYNADEERIAIWSAREIWSIYDELTSPLSMAQPVFPQSTSPVAEISESIPKQESVNSSPGIMIPILSTNLKTDNYEAVASLDHQVNNLGIIEAGGS